MINRVMNVSERRYLQKIPPCHEPYRRALHNLYFLKEGGLFFSSLPGRRPYGPEAEAFGLVFSATYLWGSFTLFPLPAGFPPLISCEKTAPLRQSLQKSPPSFLGLQRLSGCAKISIDIALKKLSLP
jgi:hypothetical protein